MSHQAENIKYNVYFYFKVPLFPVFTRSGEITVSVELIDNNITYTEEDLPRLNHFHRFVFSRVLRLEKDPMSFDYAMAESSYIIVPVTKGKFFIA